MSSSFFPSIPSASGSQTAFVLVENARHSGAMSVSLPSLRVQKLTLFHALSRKKIFPQNDHFINLFCLIVLLPC